MSQPFRLVDLPRELREIIFDLCFEDYAVLLSEGYADTPFWLTASRSLPPVFRANTTLRYSKNTNSAAHRDDLWQVLKVSRRINAEAWESFYCNLKTSYVVVNPHFLHNAMDAKSVVLGPRPGPISPEYNVPTGTFRRLQAMALDMQVLKEQRLWCGHSWPRPYAFDVWRAFKVIAFDMRHLKQLVLGVAAEDMVLYHEPRELRPKHTHWLRVWFMHLLGSCVDLKSYAYNQSFPENAFRVTVIKPPFS